MASVNQLMSGLNQRLAVLNRKVNFFFAFIGNKLKNFKNLTLGEQISFSFIGAGLLLIMTSIVLFVI